MLDSGATSTYINRSIANILGLNLKGAKKITVDSIGAQMTGYESVMKITIYDTSSRKAVSAKIPIIVLDNTHLDEVVYGRIGLFNLFQITFHENSKKVVLKPIKNDKLPHFLRM